MDYFIEISSIVLYLLVIVLLVVLIILGIKLIISVNKANRVLSDVEHKLKSLNVLFNIIDTVTNGLSSVSNRLAENVAIFMGSLFSKKNNKEKEEE